MSLQDLGALGELVGGVAVILSLVYIAYQIRQNSRLIEQNSRQIEASTYFATGDAFNRWWAQLARDGALADLWRRGLAGESLSPAERTRFQALLFILFNNFENNHHQLRIGSVQRDSLSISREIIARLLSAPGGRRWWERESQHMFAPDFRKAIDEIRASASRSDEVRSTDSR